MKREARGLVSGRRMVTTLKFLCLNCCNNFRSVGMKLVLQVLIPIRVHPAVEASVAVRWDRAGRLLGSCFIRVLMLWGSCVRLQTCLSKVWHWVGVRMAYCGEALKDEHSITIVW